MTQHPTPKKAGALPRPGGAQVKPTVPVPAVRRATPILPVPLPPLTPVSLQQRLPGPATHGKHGHIVRDGRMAASHSPMQSSMAAAARPGGIQASLRAPAPRVSSPSVASAHVRPQARVSSAATTNTAKTTVKDGAAAFRRPAPSNAIQRLPYSDLEKTPGYTSWNEGGSSWHINYTLGDKKSGREVYHVTKDGNPKIHYFFSTDGLGNFRDEVGTGRKQTRKKFSDLPARIQATVTEIF